jgi:hypothetical protein
MPVVLFDGRAAEQRPPLPSRSTDGRGDRRGDAAIVVSRQSADASELENTTLGISFDSPTGAVTARPAATQSVLPSIGAT